MILVFRARPPVGLAVQVSLRREVPGLHSFKVPRASVTLNVRRAPARQSRWTNTPVGGASWSGAASHERWTGGPSARPVDHRGLRTTLGRSGLSWPRARARALGLP
jgi:hypothetical protein